MDVLYEGSLSWRPHSEGSAYFLLSWTVMTVARGRFQLGRGVMERDCLHRCTGLRLPCPGSGYLHAWIRRVIILTWTRHGTEKSAIYTPALEDDFFSLPIEAACTYLPGWMEMTVCCDDDGSHQDETQRRVRL